MGRARNHERDNLVLDILREHGPCSARDVNMRMPREYKWCRPASSPAAASCRMLERDGVLKRRSKRLTGRVHYYVYWIADDA